MKKIGYARVSTREQSVNSQALEQQVARLQPYVDEVFVDVESGKNDNRKNFKKIESLVKSGEPVSLVVTRLDRLSRKLITLKKIIDLLILNNGEIRALDNNIDTSSAAGKFHISLLGALAEMESDQISERVKHGINHLMKNGKAYHPPFGFLNQSYTFTHDKRPFLCLLSAKDEWSRHDIAVLIIHKYLEIKSLNAVSFWLQDVFNISMLRGTIAAWLQNPALLGHIYYKKTKEFFYDQHEPLMDKELILKALELSKFNSKTKGFSKRCNYNLSSLCWCACGHKASIRTVGKRSYIECPLYNRCPQSVRRVRNDVIENKVFQSISNHAHKLANCLSQTEIENPKIKQLQSELFQLESIPNSHKAIQTAILELKADIEREKNKGIKTSETENRQLFIDTFSDLEFWEFYLTQPLETRQSLMRKFVKKIVFNPFQIEFNL